MKTTTGRYLGYSVEAREGEGGFFYAWVNGIKSDVAPSKVPRRVVNRAIEQLKQAEAQRLREMDWSEFFKDPYTLLDYPDESLKDWLKAFDGADPDRITLPDVPFSFPEIQRELLRRERCKQAMED